MLLFLTFIVLTCITYAKQDREFYAIAHMANNEQAVRWAMRSGANALEIDLQFNRVTGAPTDVHHGIPCDCTCYLDLFPGSVCDLPAVCTGNAPYKDVFAAIMNDTHLDNLALIYIDSKTSKIPAKTLPLSGVKVIEMIEEHFFIKGYIGRILIGTGQREYIDSVIKQAYLSQWRDQIYVTYDMFGNSLEAIELMAKLPYPNKIFSIGISACSPNRYYHDATLGAINKAKGLISDVFSWTVDSEATWEEYYIAGARGIITNYVHNMLEWVSRKGLKLAKPGNDRSLLPSLAISPSYDHGPWDNAEEHLVTDIGSCDCGYTPGGCSIFNPAPAYSACRCVYDLFWSCSGQVVGCDQVNSKLCKDPDLSIRSCVEGGGDCGGYLDAEVSCDCQYSYGGCSIYDSAVVGYACKCSYDGFWMCSGHITKCRDPYSAHCNEPDTSIFSCLEGKGDCGGYTDYTCECTYASGGCTITKPSPINTACYCSYRGAWTCAGSIVSCLDDSSYYCKNPDISIGACVQSGGDCGAYSDTCDCTYVDEGCVISSPSPPMTACHCYNGYSGCYGYIEKCGVSHSDSCLRPDTSLDSCLQGGGDCVGYSK